MKKSVRHNSNCTRRDALGILGAAGLVTTFPTIVPSSVLGAVAPSNRINVAMIGMGRQAVYANLKPFLHSDDARVVAVCDVDKWRLNQAKEAVDKLKAAGVQFVEVDKKAFYDATQPVRDKYGAKYAALLKQIQAS